MRSRKKGFFFFSYLFSPGEKIFDSRGAQKEVKPSYHFEFIEAEGPANGSTGQKPMNNQETIFSREKDNQSIMKMFEASQEEKIRSFQSFHLCWGIKSRKTKDRAFGIFWHNTRTRNGGVTGRFLLGFVLCITVVLISFPMSSQRGIFRSLARERVEREHYGIFRKWRHGLLSLLPSLVDSSSWVFLFRGKIGKQA